MTFHIVEARREQTPLLIGLVGPSGSGKTLSALRLATGIQKVVGGDIVVIDTEARRSLHYAGVAKFKHMQFDPPHGPDRYLEALQAAIAAGAKTVIVDSTSHEHEGAGGVLEMHEAELDRMAGQDYRKREAMNMIAWAKPKGLRRKLINGLLQMNCNFIFCFRAKEKMKMTKDPQTGKTKPTDAGWQAIAGDEFVYEQTLRCLLPPGASGVPDFSPDAWATGVPKLPDAFASIVNTGNPLDEAMGEALAKWAMGGKPTLSTPPAKETGDAQKLWKIAGDMYRAFEDIGWTKADLVKHLGHPVSPGDRPGLERKYRELTAAGAGVHSDQPGADDPELQDAGVPASVGEDL